MGSRQDAVLTQSDGPSDTLRSVLDSNRRHSDVPVDISGQQFPLSASRLQDLGAKAFFRAREAAELGVQSRDLRRLMDDGFIERVARGLYRFADAEVTEHYTEAAVCARVPDAIVCLYSALTIHEARHSASTACLDCHSARRSDAPASRASRQGGPLHRSIAALWGRGHNLRGCSHPHHKPGPHRSGLLPLEPPRRHQRGDRGDARRCVGSKGERQ